MKNNATQRKIRMIYDNEGRTLDRYLIVLNSYRQTPSGEVFRECLTVSPDLSVSLWDECEDGPHGRPIEFSELPTNVQQHVLKRLEI